MLRNYFRLKLTYGQQLSGNADEIGTILPKIVWLSVVWPVCAGRALSDGLDRAFGAAMNELIQIGVA